MNLTYDEQQLIAIFNAGTRDKTIAALEEMSTELEPDETELRDMTASVLTKLRDISDTIFEALDLTLEFDA